MLRRLRNAMFCVLLAVNLIHGVPMRVDEIEALLAAMTKPKLAHVLQQEDHNGDD